MPNQITSPTKTQEAQELTKKEKVALQLYCALVASNKSSMLPDFLYYNMNPLRRASFEAADNFLQHEQLEAERNARLEQGDE